MFPPHLDPLPPGERKKEEKREKMRMRVKFFQLCTMVENGFSG